MEFFQYVNFISLVKGVKDETIYLTVGKDG